IYDDRATSAPTQVINPPNSVAGISQFGGKVAADGNDLVVWGLHSIQDLNIPTLYLYGLDNGSYQLVQTIELDSLTSTYSFWFQPDNLTLADGYLAVEVPNITQGGCSLRLYERDQGWTRAPDLPGFVCAGPVIGGHSVPVAPVGQQLAVVSNGYLGFFTRTS